ncbi:MAG: YihY/virulence factor BrkB family protein [Acidimicrobiaceae bacterium]|nr:YihY/virulence factor BrkB family protein [Acidimicrobiaceae bacterium]
MSVEEHPGAGRAGGGDDAPPVDAAPSRSKIERAQGVQQRVKATAGDAEVWLRRRREHDRRVDYALSLLERDRSTGGIVLAGAVAFRLFLFFVPFVAFVVVMLGIGPAGSDQDLARRLRVGGLVAKAAHGTNHLSTWERITSLVLIGFALLIAARTFYRVLHVVFSLEWSLPVRRVRATKPGLALIGFVAVCIVAELGLSRLRHDSPIGGPFGTIFFFLLPAGFWLIILEVLPHDRESPWWIQLPGALLIAIGVEAVHLVTIYWIAHQVAAKSNLYGGIGSSLAILLWAYLMGRLIVAAAVVNSLLWDRRKARQQPSPQGGEQPA